MSSFKIRRLAAVLLTLALFAAACGDDDDTATEGDGATGGATTSETETATDTQTGGEPGEFNAEAGKEFALEYTGGTDGEATGDPITIGWINQEGGVVSFPDITFGFDAAVEYLNNELGGIGGRPLAAEKCFVQAEEDGQACGTQFANNPEIDVVLSGFLGIGAGSLYQVLGNNKPVLIGSLFTPPDFTYSNGVSYQIGGPGTNITAVKFVADHIPNSDQIALITAEGAVGRATVAAVEPVAAAEGLELNSVLVSEGATGPEVAAAIQNSGAAQADALMAALPPNLTIALYDGWRTLGDNAPPVIAPFASYIPQLIEAAGGTYPENWHGVTAGYNVFIPGSDDVEGSYAVDAYRDATERYGAPNVDYTTSAIYGFASVMSIARFMNELIAEGGEEAVTPQALAEKMKTFEGPAWMVGGELGCGTIPNSPAACVLFAGVEKFENGAWVPAADAYNDQLIAIYE